MPDDHKEALELVEEDWHADSDNREASREDLEFVASDQWDAAERTERESEGRPCLTINRMNGFINQVAGDIRQSQPAVEVFPVDSQEDKQTAEIYEGLIRQIEYQSGAQAAYAHGAESAVRCSIGHWRLETVETEDSVFEQDIRIKRILDPLSVVWDANATELDRSDAKRVWVTDLVHKNTFKKRFKDAGREGQSVPIDNIDDGTGSLFWHRDDFIRIAEYWYLKPKERFLVLTVDGRTVDLTDMDRESVFDFNQRNQVIGARKVQGHEVVRRVMDGNDWLDDEEPWAGRFFPIVPVLGPEVAFDGKIIRKSLIRDAKDAQKLYNYWRSAAAEAIGKAPKAPWLVTPTMIEDYEGYWSNANRSNLPFLLYKPDPSAPTAAPIRQDPPNIPTAMWQEGALAGEDMKATTGIFDASLGAQGNETSGRAILARQREGDVGAFVFTDNFTHAMRRTGQILVDLIPRIYDTARQVRVLGKDGEEQFAQINTPAMSIDGQPILVNDLSHGRFDVRIKVGASYTTQRIEAREQIAEAMQGNPQLWSVIGDLFFKNSDYEGADEIAERLKRTISPEILNDQPTQPEPDPLQEVAERLGVEEKQAEIQKLTADAEKTAAETEQIKLENIVTAAAADATAEL